METAQTPTKKGLGSLAGLLKNRIRMPTPKVKSNPFTELKKSALTTVEGRPWATHPTITTPPSVILFTYFWAE
jgi:hypothetical protein